MEDFFATEVTHKQLRLRFENVPELPKWQMADHGEHPMRV